MRTRLTERDLSRIVRRVIKEQDESDNFCEDAVVNTNHLRKHLEVLQDIETMKERFDQFLLRCDLDAAMVFILMFEPIVQKYNELTDLDIEGIDIEEYIKHLREKYDI